MIQVRNIGISDSFKALLRLKNSDLSVLTEIGDDSDPAILNFGKKKILVPTRTQHLESIMAADQKELVKSPKAQYFTKLAMGKGLVSTDREEWIIQRKEVKGIFGPAQLQQVNKALLHSVSSSIQSQKQTTDLFLFLNRLSIRAIGSALFGRMDAADEDSILNAVKKSAKITFQKILYPVPYISDPFNLQLSHGRRTLMRLIDKRVQQARVSGTPCIVNTYFPNDKSLEKICNILLAGYETTATTLFWLIHELSKRADIQSQVEKELSTVNSEEPYNSLMNQVPLTLSCIKETLRLYPPIWIMSRSPIKHMTFGNLRLGANYDIIVSPYLFHRIPEYWPYGNSFKPVQSNEYYDRPYYFPFGKGPRSCIGERIAFLEIVHIMKALSLSGYKVEVKKVKPKAHFTLRPDNRIYLTLKS